jgi:hypothetical protein
MSEMSGIGKLSRDDLFLTEIRHYSKKEQERQKSSQSHSPVFFWKLQKHQDDSLDKPDCSCSSGEC